MKLVDIRDYCEELALLIDDDIEHHNGYKMTSFDNSHDLLHNCITIMENNTGYFWGISIDNKIAGFFGFYAHATPTNDYCFLTRTYLLKNYRSSGVNKHLKEIISTVFNHYRLPLYAKIHKDNPRSIGSILRMYGVFQYYDNDYSVFMLSHGDFILKDKVINVISRVSNKINILMSDNVVLL